MNKNIGTIDKIIRIIIAVTISIVYIAGEVPGVFGFIFLAFGGFVLITAIVNFCPLYKFLGLKSRKNKY